MKMLRLSLRTALIVQAVVEIAGGITLLFNPAFMFLSTEINASYLAVSKILGISALTVGLISYQMVKHFEYTTLIRMIVLMCMVYHLLIGFQMYAAYKQQLTNQLGAFVVHMIIALVLLYCYMNERKNFTE